MTGTRPLLLITGIAEGFGASLARLFAASGHDVLGLSRSEAASERIGRLVGEQGGSYAHRPCDITQPEQVAAALQPDTDRVSVFVHNAHSLVIGTSDDTTLDEFERAWRGSRGPGVARPGWRGGRGTVSRPARHRLGSREQA